MGASLYLILLICGYQTVCLGLQFINEAKSWVNAAEFCKNNKSKLACISSSDLDDLKQNSIQNAWVDTVTTFSSWIKSIGCIADPFTNISGIQVSSEKDVGTCQLACRNSKYFGLKNRKCMCFRKKPQNIPVNQCSDQMTQLFEKGKDDMDDMKDACKALYCNRNLPRDDLPLSNLTSCTYNKNKHLSICSYGNSSVGLCINYEQFQHEDNVKETTQLYCKKFNMKCNDRSCNNGRYIFVEDKDRNVFRQSGFMSTRNDEEFPILSCTKIKMNYSQDRLRVAFIRTNNCSEQSPFICNKEEETSNICNLKNLNDQATTTTQLTTRREIPQTTTTEATENERNTLAQKISINAGETAGIATGACFLVVLVLVITLVICKRYRCVKLRRELESQQFSNIASTNLSYERASYTEMTSEYDYIKEPGDYKTIESDYNKNEFDTTTGYEEPFNLQDNYFILEPENTKLSVESNTKVDKESDCDYIDTKEGDYDHLHGTKERKTTDHTNVYEHGHVTGNKDNTYDTAKSHNIESDGSHYDSTLYTQQKDDNDMKG